MIRHLLTLSAFITLLSACAFTPDNNVALSISEDINPSLLHTNLVSEQVPDSTWWKQFNDPQLNQLVNAGFASNTELKTAFLRIEESRARWGVVASADSPTLSANGSYNRQALSANSPLARLGAPSSAINQWQAGVSASWELDFWGYQAQLSRAAENNMRAMEYTAESVRVALAAEITSHYLQLKNNQIQQVLIEQQLSLLDNQIDYVTSQVRNGAASQDAIKAIEASRLALARRLPDLKQTAHSIENQLAYLIGKPPGSVTLPMPQPALLTRALPTFDGDIRMGVPSDILRHRPDILAAEAKLQSALANQLAAKADFYPRVSLNGNLGLLAFSLSDLGSWDSRFFNIGPTFHLPIFDGGRLEQTLALTEATQKQAATAYRDTVLRAFHETDNALSAITQANAKLRLSKQRLRTWDTLVESTKHRLAQGTASSLDLVIAQLSQLQATNDYISDNIASQMSIVSLQRTVARSTTVAGSDSYQAGAL